jgi:hypothetical protein
MIPNRKKKMIVILKERLVGTILKRYKHAGYTKTSHFMGARFHGDTK